MPYVSRDANGRINGLFANPQAGFAEEFLEDARSRELAEATLYKYRLLFRQLEAFAAKKGLRYLV